jgi:broad specificity phosphatase PhoE
MQDRKPEIWIIRHGETEWSLAGRHTGRTDLPLTVAGERAAEALGRSLAGRSFAQVLSSPLLRARETCRLAGFGNVARASDDLMEWDYGSCEGRTSAEIRREVPGWSLWTHGAPGGETLDQVALRARRVIEAATKDGDVALFAHGHLLRILTACYLGLPPDAGKLFFLEPASPGILGFERDQRALLAWNLRHPLGQERT